MRVVDREKSFSTFPHLSLGGEKLLGRSFVGYLWIQCYVAKPVDRSNLMVDTANQSTTFIRRSFSRMSNDSCNVFRPNVERGYRNDCLECDVV